MTVSELLNQNMNLQPAYRRCLVAILLLFGVSCNVTGNDMGREGSLIETGIASWYSDDFHDTPTANGETYDRGKLTAAHPTLPFDTIVRVVNTENNNTVDVRINDRGPFVPGRVIDLSRRAAMELGILISGLADVEIYLIREGK